MQGTSNALIEDSKSGSSSRERREARRGEKTERDKVVLSIEKTFRYYKKLLFITIRLYDYLIRLVLRYMNEMRRFQLTKVGWWKRCSPVPFSFAHRNYSAAHERGERGGPNTCHSCPMYLWHLLLHLCIFQLNCTFALIWLERHHILCFVGAKLWTHRMSKLLTYPFWIKHLFDRSIANEIMLGKHLAYLYSCYTLPYFCVSVFQANLSRETLVNGFVTFCVLY